MHPLSFPKDEVKRMNIKKCSVGLATLLMLLLATPTMAMAADKAEAPDTTTKVYHFVSASEEDLSYDADKEITVDGKKYILDHIDYEVKNHNKPVTEKKTTTTTDKENYAKQITKNIDGKEYTLTAKKPEWKEVQVGTEVREYAAENEVANSIEKDGKTYQLTDVQSGSKSEDFSVDATFTTSDPNSNLFDISGKIVEISDTPTWDGWEDDVQSYLAASGSEYTVTGARWSGDYIKTNNGYARTATFTGVRQTPVWMAVYTGNAEYTAEITYVDSANPDGTYDVDALATYKVVHTEENHSNLTTTLLAIGGGIAVLAVAGACILTILKKKKKDPEEQ